MEYFTYDMYLKSVYCIKLNALCKLNEKEEVYNNRKINNYHDKLFRDLLANNQDVVRLINNFLKPTKTIGINQTQLLLKKLEWEENDMPGMLETNLRKERMKLIAESEKRGIERGEKRGRIEGNREGIIYVAKEMLKEKMSTEKIMKITKLKEEEIEKIKAELASA